MRNRSHTSDQEPTERVTHADPFRCRMWALHDRLDEYITAESCRAEIESFEKHGQFVAVLGRASVSDSRFDIELIYGARRLFVARHLNRPLLVRLCSLSDQQALIAMDAENRQRRDISPYERGLSYAQLLRAGHFSSQDEIARVLHVSPSMISRLLKLARLPAVIVSAFGDPTNILESWGLELADACADPLKRSTMIKSARNLLATSPLPPPLRVYEQLITPFVSVSFSAPTRQFS